MIPMFLGLAILGNSHMFGVSNLRFVCLASGFNNLLMFITRNGIMILHG